MPTIISNSLTQLSIFELNEQLTKIHTACVQIFTNPKHGDKDMISLLFYRHEVGDVTLELEERISMTVQQDDTLLAARTKAIYLDLLFRWMIIMLGDETKQDYPDSDVHDSPECFPDPGTPEWYRFRPYIRLHAHESTFYPSDLSDNVTTLDPSLWTEECPCCLELLPIFIYPYIQPISIPAYLKWDAVELG
ncbi:uncharacterized protein MELLADRAFT_104652 [Melampsora larici-populina 98AG31]|uniref:Uncharacterized protein n=1 Tax=Melampsora larici-populina (strain 98AG31 / pathotype 3-4-7) TaxID=747676 RepID=F4RFG0_MELLP|nr:uncharacterized protein MELLADRAFT_104652 [Melampsora larici-populina 98AG31]EGG08803.1 hypothetical protein MELLADRAFT_104652 [Melampsora larici-populina 98AG31]